MKLIFTIFLITTQLLFFPNLVVANTKDGLVFWLKLDETSGTTLLDSSWRGNTGTLVNTPTSVLNCPRGNCWNFNGTNQYITVANSASLQITNTITINFWMKPNAVNAFYTTINKYFQTASQRSYYLYCPSDVGGMRFYANNTFVASNASITTAGVWQMVTVTYDLSNVNFYVNTVSGGTAAFSQPMTAGTDPLYVGSNDGVTQNFAGQLDDVRIYNRIITTQEMKDLYNQGIRLNYAPGT